MAISTGASEKVRPYLEVILTEVGTALQKAAPIGIYDTALEFKVEMLPAETENVYGGTTCRARVTSVIQNADRAIGNQQVSDLTDHVAELIRRRANQNRPAIAGKGPPWIPPITIVSTAVRDNSNQLTAVWEIEIPTAIGGFR